MNNLSNTPTTITGQFSNPATVVTGQQYAIVIVPPERFGFGAQFSEVKCPGSLYLGQGTATSGQFREYMQFDLTFAIFVSLEPTPEPTPEPGQQPNQPQGAPAPITQDTEQESEAGEIAQSFEVS